MGLNLTRTKAGINALVTQGIKRDRDWVIRVLGDGGRQGGYVRLATIVRGWKLSVPKEVRRSGNPHEVLQVPLEGCVIEFAGSSPITLRQVLERAVAYDLLNARTGEFTRYAAKPDQPAPFAVATAIYKLAVEQQEGDVTTPVTEPA
jgi:hypothetical protein